MSKKCAAEEQHRFPCCAAQHSEALPKRWLEMRKQSQGTYARAFAHSPHCSCNFSRRTPEKGRDDAVTSAVSRVPDFRRCARA
jgi:hypothetical protein